MITAYFWMTAANVGLVGLAVEQHWTRWLVFWVVWCAAIATWRVWKGGSHA